MKITRFRIHYAVMIAVQLGSVCLIPRVPLSSTDQPTDNCRPPGVSSIQVPPGFRVELFATGLNGPRFVNFGPDRSLLSRKQGANRILALADRDHDGGSDLRSIFADELPRRTVSSTTRRTGMSVSPTRSYG